MVLRCDLGELRYEYYPDMFVDGAVPLESTIKVRSILVLSFGRKSAATGDPLVFVTVLLLVYVYESYGDVVLPIYFVNVTD